MLHRNKLDSYRRVHVQTASPVKKIVMVYDTILTHLRRAAEAFDLEESPNRIEAIHNPVQQASKLILELQLALDTDTGGPVAAELHRLYDFWLTHLSNANSSKDRAAIESVIEMVREVREAWSSATAPA